MNVEELSILDEHQTDVYQSILEEVRNITDRPDHRRALIVNTIYRETLKTEGPAAADDFILSLRAIKSKNKVNRVFAIDNKFYTSGVYKIINTNNNKIYVGSSPDMSKRLRNHATELSSGSHPNPALQLDFNDKSAVWEVDVLERTSYSDRFMREQYWLDKLEPWAWTNNGYNYRQIATRRNNLHLYSNEAQDDYLIRALKMDAAWLNKYAINVPANKEMIDLFMKRAAVASATLPKRKRIHICLRS